ncbi:MAG: Hsp20/alpha crystallin family protein [Planctomycetes bacterium]|nr:Hsp20/alpha crystallin family protein [Planctomycetota bacterium]
MPIRRAKSFDLSPVFDDLFHALPSVFGAGSRSQRSWVPAVDVRETDANFTLQLDLPGLTKEDVKIELEDRLLTISGERKFVQDEPKDSGFHRVERSYGSFTRSFRLPDVVDGQQATATFENGVLTVTLPKSEDKKSRSIEIR